MPIASASVFSPHHPVEMVQVPKPTSLTRMSVPGKTRYFMIASWKNSAQQARCCGGEIRDDHIRSRAANAEQALHHHALTIDPATLGRRLYHSELAAHLVRG